MILCNRINTVDSLYELKGAAKPAQEYYAPKVEEPEKKDLLQDYHHRLFEIPEGENYLVALFEYATALHNLTNKSKEALAIFEEMLELDHQDNMVLFISFFLLDCTCGEFFVISLSLESKRTNPSLLSRSSRCRKCSSTAGEIF
jgi:hypothetical protein